MIKRTAATVIAILVFLQGHAQVLSNKDSLLRLLPAAREDSNAVSLYIEIGQQYENNDPAKAAYYYQRAGTLSRKINYPRGIIKFIVNYTYLLNLQGKYDSSLLLNLQSVDLARQIKDSLYLAKTLFNTGTSYRSLADYEKAVACYEEGKVLFEKFGNAMISAQADDILQLLYSDLHQYEKGVFYGERSVAAFRKMGETYLLVSSLNNLGNNYTSLGQFKKAQQLFEEQLVLSRRNGDKNAEVSANLNLCNNLLQQGKHALTKPYLDKALALSKELELAESEAIALKGLSFYYTYTRHYPLAKQLAEEALAICVRNNFKIQREKVYAQLSDIAYAMQDMEAGDAYARMSTSLADSLLNETLQKNAQELEKKYETATKEGRIRQLESERKIRELTLQQKNTLNYILAAVILLMAILAFLLFRNYRQRQKLQHQRINELEKEKQLAATEAVLKGEEQERSRLAKDLHDGLGGMLSGIKFSFNSMKGNMILTPEHAQAFERSMDMLDSSIKEMRRVAHNLMPEALAKFGLDTALQDFCNDISKSGALEVSYQSIDISHAVIPQTTAIAVYRIVQELINNSIKHAAATTAIVQVSVSQQTLSLTVEDDGKGFDLSLLDSPKGIGWQSIRNRVDFLKGKLDVNSHPGKGTSVLIELSIA